MATLPSFRERLTEIILPTTNQSLTLLVVALVLIVVTHLNKLLQAFGITKQAISITGSDLHQQLFPLLSSPITGQAALIVFWAAVGLIAYLACWSVYNLMIEARNEVTLSTEYTNKVSSLGYVETLGLKALCGVGLVITIILLWPGLPLWIGLAGKAIIHPQTVPILLALAGVIGLAAQLYTVLVFVQLTFTPWYRVEPFTEL
jgi:hypothetical protein